MRGRAGARRRRSDRVVSPAAASYNPVMNPDPAGPRRSWLSARAEMSGGWFALLLQLAQGGLGALLAVWAIGWPDGYGRAALAGFVIGDLAGVFGFVATQGYLDPGRKFPAFAFALDMAFLLLLLLPLGAGLEEVESFDRHANTILTGAGLGAVGFLGRFIALAWRAIVHHVYGRRMPPLYKETDDDENPIAS